VKVEEEAASSEAPAEAREAAAADAGSSAAVRAEAAAAVEGALATVMRDCAWVREKKCGGFEGRC
jgi:hypothetical protein